MSGPPRARLARPLRFVRNRFSPESYLGLHLTIGVLVILLAGWCFSEIAETLSPGVPLLDLQVTTWFHARARPGLTELSRIVTFFGSVGFLTGASICAALLLAQRRAWDRFLALILAMLGGGLLNIALKHFFHRQRPVLENPLVTLASFGFPSGHTMGSTLFYGSLAILLAHSVRGRRWRIVVITVAILIVTAIGVTRIYLGAHYLSDVLAAVAAGILWLSFSWTTVETFRRRRENAAQGMTQPEDDAAPKFREQEKIYARKKEKQQQEDEQQTNAH